MLAQDSQNATTVTLVATFFVIQTLLHAVFVPPWKRTDGGTSLSGTPPGSHRRSSLFLCAQSLGCAGVLQIASFFCLSEAEGRLQLGAPRRGQGFSECVMGTLPAS
ncbi:unnamed protein product [Boreogadus saida]